MKCRSGSCVSDELIVKYLLFTCNFVIELLFLVRRNNKNNLCNRQTMDNEIIESIEMLHILDNKYTNKYERMGRN